jgi:N4-gp56 family major capsid protein
MANEVDTGIGTAFFSNVVQAGLFTLNETSIMRPLIRNYDMTGTPGLTAQVPIYPTVAVSTPGDGADLSNAAFDLTTSKTITASEKGVMVTLTDLMKETASEDVASAIGRQIGSALAEKVDTDIAALFSGFSNTVGTGADEISIEDLFKAAATLRTNKVPSGPLYCVLHPKQAFQIKKLLTNAGSTINHNLSDLGNEALRNGFVGTLAGMQIFESTVITGDSAGAFVGAAFHGDALGYMVKRALRVENQRDASLRADEIVGSMAYGVSEIFDEYGVGIIGDANL